MLIVGEFFGVLFHPKPKNNQSNKGNTNNVNQNIHLYRLFIVKNRKRFALVTTVREEAAMAAAAIIGLSKTPSQGYKTPAAMGMPIIL